MQNPHSLLGLVTVRLFHISLDETTITYHVKFLSSWGSKKLALGCYYLVTLSPSLHFRTGSLLCKPLPGFSILWSLNWPKFHLTEILSSYMLVFIPSLPPSVGVWWPKVFSGGLISISGGLTTSEDPLVLWCPHLLALGNTILTTKVLPQKITILTVKSNAK